MHRPPSLSSVLVRVVAVVAALACLSTTAAPQPARHVYRVGYLSLYAGSAPSSGYDELRKALATLGYVDGRNLAVETRFADAKDDRVPLLLEELVSRQPDLLVVEPVTAAIARLPRTLPIIAVGGDLLATRLVASLVRPGGNVTGVAFVDSDLAPERVDLLKKLTPDLRRVAVLADWATDGSQLNMPNVAKALGLYIETFTVRKPDELDETLGNIRKKHFNGLVLMDGPVLNAHRERLAETASQQRVPAIGSNPIFAETGGLMSYGPNQHDVYRRAASLVDRILRGGHPRELPAERPSRFDLTINSRVARQLGLPVPPALLRRAAHVIQ